MENYKSKGMTYTALWWALSGEEPSSPARRKCAQRPTPSFKKGTPSSRYFADAGLIWRRAGSAWFHFQIQVGSQVFPLWKFRFFFFPFTGFQCQCALLGIGHRKLNPSFEIEKQKRVEQLVCSETASGKGVRMREARTRVTKPCSPNQDETICKGHL